MISHRETTGDPPSSGIISCNSDAAIRMHGSNDGANPPAVSFEVVAGFSEVVAVSSFGGSTTWKSVASSVWSSTFTVTSRIGLP
eukprot:COSAG06_NODE_2835_length_6201_cov_127.447722_2_plen_84_part_00